MLCPGLCFSHATWEMTRAHFLHPITANATPALLQSHALDHNQATPLLVLLSHLRRTHNHSFNHTRTPMSAHSLRPSQVDIHTLPHRDEAPQPSALPGSTRSRLSSKHDTGAWDGAPFTMLGRQDKLESQLRMLRALVVVMALFVCCGTTLAAVHYWHGADSIRVPVEVVPGSPSQAGQGNDAASGEAPTPTPATAEPVDTDGLANSAVTADKIAMNAVTEVAIQAGSVTGEKLAPLSVSGEHLLPGAINEASLSVNSVSARTLQHNSVTASAISAGAVTSAGLAADAVTSVAVQEGSIQSFHLAFGAITGTQVSQTADVQLRSLVAQSVDVDVASMRSLGVTEGATFTDCTWGRSGQQLAQQLLNPGRASCSTGPLNMAGNAKLASAATLQVEAERTTLYVAVRKQRRVYLSQIRRGMEQLQP